MIEPALCKTITHEQLPYKNYIAEVKYDGRRAFLIRKNGQTYILGREGNTITDKFPEVKAIGKYLPDNTILDGEIIVGNDFNALQRHAKNGEMAEFVAFDVLRIDNEDIRNKPLTERRTALEELSYNINMPNFSLSEQEIDQLKLWERALTKQLEGIVLKDLNSSYEGKRTDAWVKVKRMEENIVIAEGFTSDTREVSALITPLGKVNVANTEDQVKVKEAFENNWKVIAEVEYMGLTKNGKMRQPVMKEIRIQRDAGKH